MLSKCLLLFLALVLTVSVTAVAEAQETQPSTPTTPVIKAMGISLEGFDYPFPVQFLPIEEQGESLKLAYMDVKPERPNGQAVLLLHGKNFCGAYWEHTARDLSAKGYRVLIPDQIGFGKSSKPTGIQYSFQMMANHTLRMLQAAGVEQVNVVGHSMGGMVATRFTLMYPKVVRSLTLVNPIGLEDWRLSVPYRSVDDWYARELKANYESLRQYQLTSYFAGHWKPEYDRWVILAAGTTLSPEYPRLARVSAKTSDMIFTQPVMYEFDKITAPTLLIIGQRDRTAIGRDAAPKEVAERLGNYPDLGRRTQKLIPGSKLVELDDLGHVPQFEAYDRYIAPLVEFLEQVKSRP